MDASYLALNGAESVVVRVVALARNTLQFISAKELQLLQNTLTTGSPANSTENSSFRSFAEWCSKMASPGFVTNEDGFNQGSNWFTQGNLEADEEEFWLVSRGAMQCHLC
ncbi:hypothetical protein GN244_ATG09357 [Phytophthora infestans]|uniref:Uncharacterized protein n=1 Tax=Phytophthora infestans TaxID=4787 RepID=A0A833STJ0_PHYIN|nr:hypothetical protein GN244_ATG09357 [Phytophthora infestans]KAF4138689.1 hypothetical protein GN958_ATG12125 [Phytophthora infestans]